MDRASGTAGWDVGDDGPDGQAKASEASDTQNHEAAEHYGFALALSPIALWSCTPDGMVSAARPGAFESIGLDGDKFVSDWRESLHPDDRATMPDGFAAGFKEGRRLDFECRIRTRSGEYRWFRVQATPQCHDDGKILRWYGILEDVHDRRMAEEALRDSEERYRYVIALSQMIPWTGDADGGVIDMDTRGLETTGISQEEARGHQFLARQHPDDHAHVIEIWNRALREKVAIEYDSRFWVKNGGYRWHHSRAAPRLDDDGNIIRWYGTIEDVHDQRMAEEAIRWAAEHDGLTGLFNRNTFQAGLQKAIDEARTSGTQIALLLFDVDNFKQLNDRFGHDAGDAMLRDLAARIQTSVSRPMMAGRLGGDEFAMFVSRPTEEQIGQAIETAIRAFDKSFHFGNHSRECRASIGIAVFPANADCADTLRKAADLALYEAKDAGGGITRRFENKMRARMQARQSMLSVARVALDEGRIIPFYQPQVDLQSRRVTGFEALLRWHHDQKGMQLPESIWASFEDPELSAAIGRRMLGLVLGDIRRWLDNGVDFSRIALNVSAAELVREDFASWLLNHMAGMGIPADCLELEVTERVFLDRNPERIGEILNQLCDSGVSVALDDFGTGYASLVHLKRFPVNVLKIDRSFVEQVSDEDADPIVRAIVGLGKGLRITTVAEGIETEAQVRLLRQEGCDRGQGYLFSPAVAAAEVPELLHTLGIHEPSGDRRTGRIRREIDRKAVSAHH